MTSSDQSVESESQIEATRNLGLALVVICTAQLMVVLDATIVNIALPHIALDLGFTPANLQWVLTAYTLAFGGFLLLGGRAGDILGRRRVFIFGIWLFALGSLGGGLAWNEGVPVGLPRYAGPWCCNRRTHCAVTDRHRVPRR